MACDYSNCSSDCYKNEDVEDSRAENGVVKIETEKEVRSDGGNMGNLCIKCKVNVAVSVGDECRFCADCFRGNLFGKFRHAVTSHAMITPTDNVLVAFSGGPSSRVALQFVHDMQNRSQKNYDASKDRSLQVFGVGVAFVDESAGSPPHSNQMEKAIEDIESIVTSLTPPKKHLHVVPIESIYGSDLIEGQQKLRSLLDGVSDATGKEDLLLDLRMLSLQKIAAENGYNRILLGTCTSRIACHVISATVKGQGYSLPADIQYVDARCKVPVVLPLRDCPVKELNMLCDLDGLRTVSIDDCPKSGISGLVASFVALLKDENPSRECTIVRTAGKLTPFHFNKIPEINDSNVPLATRRRQKRFNLKCNETISSESFCPMCNSPLRRSELSDANNHKNNQNVDMFRAACCSSCRYQILPKDPSSVQHFYSLLPQPLVARVKHGSTDNTTLLREKIQDYLLSDSEEEIS